MRFLKQFCSKTHKTKENPKSMIHKVEEEVKQGSETDPLMPRMHCAEKEKVKRQDEEELTGIKKGDIINLPDILFTENRDYLIKYNDDQQVKAEQLVGKIILIYFAPVCLDFGMSEWTTYLTDIYNDLLPNNKFEVIFIAVDDIDAIAARQYSHLLRDAQNNFEKIFSPMLWTAIPFLDITSRRRIARRFGVSGSSFPISYLLDSKGMVLRCICCSFFGCSLFAEYGTLGYPFSNERIQFLDSEDDAAAKQPSLGTLLGSAERDYVISNKGEKVPICSLEDKVVALYFYEDRIPFHKEGGPLISDDVLTIKLKMVYKELAKKRESFEVVLLYLYDTRDTFATVNEESFWKIFKTMPWLALPFKDPNHKKLKRIFRYPWDSDGPERASTLVVFGPNGEFVDPRGADILINFGTPAYPFTREKLVKLQTEKIKELKLEMFSNPNNIVKVKYDLEWFCWKHRLRNVLGSEYEGSSFDNISNFKKILSKNKELQLDSLSRYPNTVIGLKDSSGIQFSQFIGKKLLIFFEMNSHKACDLGMKLMLLKERYLQLKGTDDDFEVIHIKESLSTNYNHTINLPWLVHYYDEGYPLPNELVPSVFGFNYYCGRGRRKFSGYSLLAFDQDGSLVRRTIYPTFSSKDFPFYAGGLEEEFLDQLNYSFHLNYWDFHSREIYKRNNNKAVKC